MAASACWKKLPSFPFNDGTDPLFINQTEFMVLTDDGILFKYNINTNKLIKLMDLEQGNTRFTEYCAFDEKQNHFYCHDHFQNENNDKILQIDLNKLSVSMIIDEYLGDLH